MREDDRFADGVEFGKSHFGLLQKERAAIGGGPGSGKIGAFTTW
jgi:hypothetical protein